MIRCRDPEITWAISPKTYPGSEDPVDSAQKILRELRRHDESLYRKPRWLVLNKLDLVAEEERDAVCEAIVAGLEWDGPVYRVSALGGEGTEALCRDIMQWLEKDEAV